ncbi:MAG: hypothetical protein LBC20_01910 [Planctomycetaceae bacterium]|jgi:hypothetical protein|nr:hypothetical protein [Planctomycetaceae bacterium]
MSYGLQKLLSQNNRYTLNPNISNEITFYENQLFFTVREPFVSRQTGIDIIGGLLNSTDQLIIESLMPDGGVIFSDGIESDFLQFVSGNTAVVKIAQETAVFVQKK